jgi:hypothetical protein
LVSGNAVSTEKNHGPVRILFARKSIGFLHQHYVLRSLLPREGPRRDVAGSAPHSGATGIQLSHSPLGVAAVPLSTALVAAKKPFADRSSFASRYLDPHDFRLRLCPLGRFSCSVATPGTAPNFVAGFYWNRPRAVLSASR